MNNNPAISVVLPTHNGSGYLDESIKSIVAQTHKNWELIVVDDASTDDTPTKIQSWVASDSRIRAVYLQENRKLPGALNEGFRHASADLFTWTSDDNCYRPSAFARMLAMLDAKPKVAVVYADSTLVDENGSPIRPMPVAPPEKLPFGNCIGACFLYRRAVHEKLGGYDEEMFLAEDYDFWLRASNDFQFEPLHEPLYFYRSHNGTLSSRKTRGIAFASENTLKRWLPTATWLSRETRVRAYVRWGRRAYQNGVPKVGRRHLLRAILVSRRPLLFAGNRWLFIEFLFGTRTRKFLQALWKRSDGAAADNEDHSDNA